ncbi:MAG TPA: chromate efflux transporter [Hyphomicrobiales bacterium]|nr:chromate efflux transporter [Kaistiaceae bacterium]HQF30147.1 chromate efflux transporter [Hyphomicrobiales bacterium]
MSHENETIADTRPTFAGLFAVWGRIGILSFGGPAAQIALMHREIVEERGWLTERQYLDALAFCMLLPGPEAMQLATYTGWRLRGWRGGLLAGLLFVLPGALVVLALAALYATLGAVPLVAALFLGVKAAVAVIVLEALLRISKKALRAPAHWAIAALAFLAIFFFAVPFPAIVFIAGLYGLLRPDGGVAVATDAPRTRPKAIRTLATILLWLAIWWLPLAAIAGLAPPVLADIGFFFSKLAVVTFGGAYAVLSYMAQEVVAGYGWLSAGEMMDGLGLAETTPGPLILVTEFVGFLAGHHTGGPGLGLAAAAVTLWATFVPCFLWIFAGAPYVEAIAAAPRLRAALAAITAAVVGVILNLAVWFALHVFFTEVSVARYGPLVLHEPALASLDLAAVALAALAAVLILEARWGLAGVLAVTAALAVAIDIFWS